MVKMRKNILLNLSLMVLWPISLMLKVPLEKVFPVNIVWGIWVLACIAFFVGLIRTMIHGKTWLRSVSVILFVWVCTTIYFDFSTNIFLGDKIAETYYAEAPGFIELKVYNRGCTFSYGGLLGVSEIFYCDYQTDDQFFWILTEESILDLELSVINLDGKDLIIKRKLS